MTDPEKRHPFLTEEDWWTVWFGLFVLLAATTLGILAASGNGTGARVPKMGHWRSNPADVLMASKTTKIKIEHPASLTELVEHINERAPQAIATLEPTPNGETQLRIASSRSEPRATISLKTLLAAGEVTLTFTPEGPDPDGLGARAWLSNTVPSADRLIGTGRVSITAERTHSVVGLLFATLIAVLLITTVGVRSMGQPVRRYALGFVVVFGFGALSFVLANFHLSKTYGLGYAAWALGLGLIVSNTVGTPGWLRPGIRTEMYIKTGLVLLGAEVLFGKILSIGLPGLMVAWIVTPVVIIFMWFFGTRILKMVSKSLVIIIAAATSVCGVSAAIAVAAAARAKKEELTLGVGLTLIFTVLMMIFMPIFIHWMGLSEALGGAWMGGTIDSTGAVVAAGAFLGPNAETVAAVVKMIQNILIGIVGFAVALFWITSIERNPDAPRPGLGQIWIRFPKFIVGFVAASLIFSFVLVPVFGGIFAGDGIALVETNVIKPFTNPLRGWFFCLAFVSIGLESNFKELASQLEGGKPLVLYLVGQTFNLILTLAVAWLAFEVLFPDAI